MHIHHNAPSARIWAYRSAPSCRCMCNWSEALIIIRGEKVVKAFIMQVSSKNKK